MGICSVDCQQKPVAEIHPVSWVTWLQSVK
jgi:hypothetical protein